MSKELICIIGLPLSGKSHLSRLLNKEYENSMIISTGDIARSLIKNQEEQQAMEKADLYHGESELLSIVENKIHKSYAEMIIVEGLPRSASQAAWLLDTFNIYFPKVIEVRAVSDEELFKRAANRARDQLDVDIKKLSNRISLAKNNLQGVRDLLTSRLCPIHTVLSDSDEGLIKQFKNIKE
jgi:adenylate kinase family enzyme